MCGTGNLNKGAARHPRFASSVQALLANVRRKSLSCVLVRASMLNDGT